MYHFSCCGPLHVPPEVTADDVIAGYLQIGDHNTTLQTLNDYRRIETSYEGAQKLLDMRTGHISDSERCNSVELDDEIRIQIGKNSAADSCKKLENSSCSRKAFSKSSALSYSGPMQVGMEDQETSSSLSERILTKQNISTDTLKQQIISLEKQRQELLAVNNQWDQQFRRMKQHYEKKVTEAKAKLETMQTSIRELEKGRHQMQQECQRLEAQAKDKLLQEMRDKKALKEENRLLKEETALTNTKKMHYECEISRLNKALLDALKNHNASLHVPYVDALNRNCSQEEMRMEMEVLRQQVQIYEEDFKRERSDRERLNEEKEALQRVNERSQLQLNELNSRIKDCQEENKLLEKQVKKQARDLRALTEKHNEPQQMFIPPCLPCGNCGLLHPYPEPQVTLATCGINRKQPPPPDYQWYVPNQFPPDVQHKANVYGGQ